MIQDLFKVPIYNTSCNVNRFSLLEYVKIYVKNNPTGRQVSNMGGYQSLDLDYTKNPIKPLVDEIVKGVYGYGKELKIKTEDNKEISPIHTALANQLVFDELASRRREGNGK